MGIFDTIKSRLSGGDHDEYAEDDRYYDDEEYYEADKEEAYEDRRNEEEKYYGDDRYYDDAPDDPALASGRRSSVFNDYTPLVSMSDVRSQELPRYTPTTPATRTRQTASQIRTSLPFVGNPAEDFRSHREEDPSNYTTGPLAPLQHNSASIYAVDDSSDPLLKRHSLSNTGDFSTTSPAYYASRSGVGHVRPAGQARRTQKFREAVVVNPDSYAEAELVASNLRRGNAVVLVLTQTRPELAKRILDFSFGAAAVSEGQVTSIGERIYALTCDYPLTDTELELLHARGVI